MSLVEPDDFKHQLHSARSWMKEKSMSGGFVPSDEAAETQDQTAIEDSDTTPKEATPKPHAPLPAALQQGAPPKVLPLSTGQASVAAGQYDRMIEDMVRTETQAEIIQHVIKVERSEVASLVKQVARAKGRYLATLLESSKGKSVPSSRIEDLKQLRDTHEELLQGLNDLRRHILDGTVMVEGVRN